MLIIRPLNKMANLVQTLSVNPLARIDQVNESTIKWDLELSPLSGPFRSGLDSPFCVHYMTCTNQE